MNFTPAFSSALQMALIVRGKSSSPRSKRVMVFVDTFAAAARPRFPSSRGTDGSQGGGAVWQNHVGATLMTPRPADTGLPPGKWHYACFSDVPKRS
jgi:hypothetical protein